MTVVLGDVNWLTSNLQNLKDMEVSVRVTNGVDSIELPIVKVTLTNKFIITCEMPKDPTICLP